MNADPEAELECHSCHNPIRLRLSGKPVSSRELELASCDMEIKCPTCGHEDAYSNVPLGSILVTGSD